MAQQQWTWSRHSHSNVLTVLAPPAADLAWCERLETAAGDALTGKALCVCAAVAVARALLAVCANSPDAAHAALDLLERWIDEPTEERFELIRVTTFAEEPPPFDPHGVVWWALRTATSSVGNFEAGWALRAACAAAERAGFRPDQLRGIVEQELASRSVR